MSTERGRNTQKTQGDKFSAGSEASGSVTYFCYTLRLPSASIITVRWPQNSWSYTCCRTVFTVSEKGFIIHSDTHRRPGHPRALSRPHHCCRVPPFLTSACITDLFTYLHLYCRPLSSLTWRGSVAVRSLPSTPASTLLVVISQWQTQLPWLRFFGLQ